MTGRQVYALNTTPTTSVPLFLTRMDIELKPYAMLPNLPSEYEVDLFRNWPVSDMAGRLIEVRSVGRSGLDLLTLSSSI